MTANTKMAFVDGQNVSQSNLGLQTYSGIPLDANPPISFRSNNITAVSTSESLGYDLSDTNFKSITTFVALPAYTYGPVVSVRKPVYPENPVNLPVFNIRSKKEVVADSKAIVPLFLEMNTTFDASYERRFLGVTQEVKRVDDTTSFVTVCFRGVCNLRPIAHLTSGQRYEVGDFIVVETHGNIELRTSCTVQTDNKKPVLNTDAIIAKVIFPNQANEFSYSGVPSPAHELTVLVCCFERLR